jgi:putative phosphonate metabolism protein
MVPQKGDGLMTAAPDTRYAVYWAPPSDSALWRFGARWLGRDPDGGAETAPGDGAASEPAWLAAVTADPRLYGLHATLKPPFRLAAGQTRPALVAALADLAARTAPVAGPKLVLRRLGRFLALVPSGPAPAIQALAARLVERLDGFRAPAGAAELAKRRAHGLTPAQEENLQRWGYPYVMDEFRFHVTLSGALEPAALDRLEELLAPRVAPFTTAPLALAALALFEQDAAGRPFRLTRRFPLAG